MKPRIFLLIVITAFLCCACTPQVINNTNTFSTSGSLPIKELRQEKNFNFNALEIAWPPKILTPEESRIKKEIEKLLIGTWQLKGRVDTGHGGTTTTNPKSAGYTHQLKFLANGQLEIYLSDREGSHKETTPYRVDIARLPEGSITDGLYMVRTLAGNRVGNHRPMLDAAMQVNGKTLLFGAIGICGPVDEYTKLK